jgi:formamidopyrimidine-DNA glycosylase
MPELPEVETIVRRIRPLLAGRRILDFEASWPRQIQPSLEAVRVGVIGRTVRAVSRRGKYAVLELGAGAGLLVHLKMSGRLTVVPGEDGERPEHLRAVLHLVGGAPLRFYDARKFGRVRFVPDLASALSQLGPEPLDRTLTTRAFHARLSTRRRQLKPLLLDQTFLAGLGNIYTDEALFRARLHPLETAARLERRQAGALLLAIRAVLRQGIRCNGASLDWIYPGGRMQACLKVYGHAGEPCPRCRTPIASRRVGQRTTCFCPACQPAPRGARGSRPR